jgi:hypothetical protein
VGIIKRKKDRVENELSGEWEFIDAGPYKGCLTKMVMTDKGHCWLAAKMTRVKNGQDNEIILRILATNRQPFNSH